VVEVAMEEEWVVEEAKVVEAKSVMKAAESESCKCLLSRCNEAIL
jgi:hypothetical protein